MCGVTGAANPGSSLFESGLAVDFGVVHPFGAELNALGWLYSSDFPTTATYPGTDWSTAALIAF